jgi:choline dehydrogenase-like flavoprotein
VDADCNVHGVENLYIAGSAAFPTSSQANPTLTVVAMALRLAEHLKRRLATAPLAVTGDAADRAGIPA